MLCATAVADVALADVALADVALADVALKAWYMRLQSTNFSEIVQCQHFSRHPVCHINSGSLLVNS